MIVRSIKNLGEKKAKIFSALNNGYADAFFEVHFDKVDTLKALFNQTPFVPQKVTKHFLGEKEIKFPLPHKMDIIKDAQEIVTSQKSLR